MAMDTHSSSEDDQIIKEEEPQSELRVTRKSLPYQSLLVELHNLDVQQEIWTSDLELAPFTRQEIWTFQQEVKLQQMIFMLLLNHGVRSQSLDEIQTIAETEANRIQDLAERIKYLARERADKTSLRALKIYGPEWKYGVSEFLETLHQKIKPHLKEFCLEIVDRLLQGNCSTGGYCIFAFIDVILLKLKDFKKLKPNLIDPVKKQMQILEETLNYAPIIARKMTNLDENLQSFLDFFEPWVNTAAAIVILHWVDEKDEKPFAMVSSSLQKFNFSILEYVEAYILVIKALRSSNVSEILVMRNTVEQFTEMILEKFIVSTDDRFDMFSQGLAFWAALLVDPPKADAEEELICSQTHLLLDQAKSLICSLCLEKLGEDVAKRRNTLLNDFLKMINKAKEEVRQLHVHQIPGLSWNNTPKTNTRGHFDFLLGNLQKKFEAEAGLFPFEKHLIAIVHKELSLLRPSLMDIFELQDEHKELRDIWVQASSIAYIVDYVTDFCLSSADIPIWSNLMHLSNAIEKILSIKTEVSKIRQNDQLNNNRVFSAKVDSQLVLPARQEAYDATTKDDFKVGYIEEEQRIIDCLVAEETALNIVAIVGMPGQGKTHLAHRVFQDTCITDRFDKLGRCCISQAYDIKKVFRDILEDIGKTVSPEQYQCQEDLADQLRKCLKGQRYLVVLDDMWDAEAWRDLQFSFPDDRNGSRILLTSRNCDVALKVKANCSIVELHSLSHEESWKLLQMKVFHGDCCPPTLYEIGKTIAKNCRGLPLAVVVVAGVLKKDKNLESWKQIFESLKPLIASEGCMDIVELSYKHLPDYLKPCFLYLGAFREDEIIDAKQLIQFWIAEGFVQIDGKKTREVVAKEYLMELVSRSLVFVAQRSSTNKIKKCRVHDLLRQLCLIKVEEEMFLLVPNDVPDHSSTLYNDHYRISVHDKLGPFLDSKPIVPGLRSLLVSMRRYSYFSMSGYSSASYTLDFLKGFKLVRVLDLTNVRVTKTGFDDITQLIHLRLLAFVCRFPIPPSIVNLLRLEVLRFHNTGVVLPSAVIKMGSLWHIFAYSCTIEYIECYDKLVPDMSSSLTNLESLTMVYFHDDELSFKRVAQSLPNVLKFGFQCSFFVRLSSYFKKLESLKLAIDYNWGQKVRVISPSTLDFPLTLKKLNLTVRFGRLSSAMISSIGKLCNLEVLKLNTNFENDRWDVEDDEFLQLKYFNFKSSSVQEWNVSEESFSCLEQLIVRGCRELEELPARFGSIITLRRIEVRYCRGSLTNSLKQIVDDKMDAGNEGLQCSIIVPSVSPLLRRDRTLSDSYRGEQIEFPETLGKARRPQKLQNRKNGGSSSA